MSASTLEHSLALEPNLNRRALMEEWVSTPGSLTERLRTTFGTELKHCLHSAGWQDQKTKESLIWHRKISFSIDEQTIVTAEVSIPETTLHSPIGLALQYCGAHSLGGVIFKDPHASGNILNYHYEPLKKLISRSLEHKPFGQTLLITEYFHPALFELLEQSAC